MNDGVTVPTIALREACSLDSLRAMIRDDPALRVIGRRFGNVRVYNAAEAEQIVQAWRAKKQKRQAVAC